MQLLLYELRKKNGLSQNDIAQLLDISSASYRSKELGYTDFKLSEMFRIANYFNKELGEIFTDSTSRNVNKLTPEG